MSRIELTPPLRAISAIALMLPLCGVAAPTISIDRVQQRYPWNKIVDIDYTIGGLETDPNDYQVVLTATAKISETETRTIVCSNYVGYALCDLPTANGANRVAWNASADGADFLTHDLSIKAELVYAPVVDMDADYLIIDMAGGTAATEFPVRYVKGDYGSSIFNTDLYKTTRLVMKRVSAGTFWMGTGNVASGTNRHRVQLTKDYFLGVFEVTYTQYNQLISHASGTYLAAERPLCPVNVVTYAGITGGDGFIAKLNARTICRGQRVAGFSLPTEAQWEYACRAGTETKYHWGDSDNDYGPYAWTSGNAGNTTRAVGTKLPNPWGFYDMTGNAYEKPIDNYAAYPAYDAEGVTVDPCVIIDGGLSIPRGGAGTNPVGSCASGFRNSTGVGGTYNTDGFRLGLTLGGAR